MRICPKCNAQNKSSNHLCANCQAFIGNIPPTEETEGDAAQAINLLQKRGTRRKVILLSLCFLFFIVFALYQFTFAVKHDVVAPYLLRCLWYVPGALLLLLPMHRLWKHFMGTALYDLFQAGTYLLGVADMIFASTVLYDFLAIPSGGI